MESVNDNNVGVAAAEPDVVNITEVPANLKNVDSIILPPPRSRLPGAAEAGVANAVPLTPNIPMTPASNFRGSVDTLSVPRIPLAERFRRSAENGSRGDAVAQQRAANESDKSDGRRSRSESDNQQQSSQRYAMLSQTYSRGSGDNGRSYKEMLDVTKSIHTSADKLQERICQLHCTFADVILKAALLFDPATVEIVGSGNGIPADLPSPTSAHFTRQEVDDNYERLVQRFLNERQGSEDKY